MAWRATLLRHVRIPAVQTLDRAPSRWAQAWNRGLSSHDDQLDKQEVIDRVLSVVKSFPKVDPSKVNPESHFQKDLGLDSLDNVEIVMAIEEEFKLEIPDKEADKIDSCNLAIEYARSIRIEPSIIYSLEHHRFGPQVHWWSAKLMVNGLPWKGRSHCAYRKQYISGKQVKLTVEVDRNEKWEAAGAVDHHKRRVGCGESSSPLCSKISTPHHSLAFGPLMAGG